MVVGGPHLCMQGLLAQVEPRCAHDQPSPCLQGAPQWGASFFLGDISHQPGLILSVAAFFYSS